MLNCLLLTEQTQHRHDINRIWIIKLWNDLYPCTESESQYVEGYQCSMKHVIYRSVNSLDTLHLILCKCARMICQAIFISRAWWWLPSHDYSGFVFFILQFENSMASVIRLDSTQQSFALYGSFDVLLSAHVVDLQMKIILSSETRCNLPIDATDINSVIKI